jgi:hypothetical protein
MSATGETLYAKSELCSMLTINILKDNDESEWLEGERQPFFKARDAIFTCKENVGLCVGCSDVQTHVTID